MPHNLNISAAAFAQLNANAHISLSDSSVVYQKAQKQDLLVINTPLCYAVIALQGAQLLAFQPHNDSPWLWLSPLACFTPGKAIRGGIPLCLPWFGVNQKDEKKPKHGFVRQQNWQLSDITELTQGLQLSFDFNYAGEQPELFETAFACRLQLTLAKELTLQLTLENHSSATQTFSWAWHSYFAVEHAAKALVSGLDGLNYLDNTQALKSVQQHGNIVFAGEVDRVYENTPSPQQLHNTAQPLTIDGSACPTCIVWNPGAQLAQSIDDVRTHSSEFVCIERGAAFANALALAAGEQFSSTMQIQKPA